MLLLFRLALEYFVGFLRAALIFGRPLNMSLLRVETSALLVSALLIDLGFNATFAAVAFFGVMEKMSFSSLSSLNSNGLFFTTAFLGSVFGSRSAALALMTFTGVTDLGLKRSERED